MSPKESFNQKNKQILSSILAMFMFVFSLFFSERIISTRAVDSASVGTYSFLGIVFFLLGLFVVIYSKIKAEIYLNSAK